MISKIVQKLYKEAKANKEFKADMIKAGESEFAKPKFHGENLIKIMYVQMYVGWKIGRGIYEPV
jgi:hypothetical protein